MLFEPKVLKEVHDDIVAGYQLQINRLTNMLDERNLTIKELSMTIAKLQAGGRTLSPIAQDQKWGRYHMSDYERKLGRKKKVIYGDERDHQIQHAEPAEPADPAGPPEVEEIEAWEEE